MPAVVPSVGGITTASTRPAAAPAVATTRALAPRVAAPAPRVPAPVPMVATTRGASGTGGGLLSGLFGLGGITGSSSMVSRAAVAPAPQIGTAYYQDCRCE
jgi:hypothetical protein